MNEVVLAYLYQKEGRTIHRNSTESDITSPGGIYRAKQPYAKIWKYIDDKAVSMGYMMPSTEWTEEVMDIITDNLDMATVDRMVTGFYTEYFKKLHLELFRDNTKIAAISMYTNSQKGAWISIQKAIRDMVRNNMMPGIMQETSKPDGVFGSKTEKFLKRIIDLSIVHQELFKAYMVSNMKTYYIRLADSNPEKYLEYLVGWDNRVEDLT